MERPCKLLAKLALVENDDSAHCQHGAAADDRDGSDACSSPAMHVGEPAAQVSHTYQVHQPHSLWTGHSPRPLNHPVSTKPGQLHRSKASASWWRCQAG